MDLQRKSRFESVVKTRIRVSDGPESKTFHGERSDLGMWRRWRLLSHARAKIRFGRDSVVLPFPSDDLLQSWGLREVVVDVF